MKKYLFSVLAAALIAPFAAFAQDETEEIVVPGRTIPKFEFSFGGGLGIGGYLGTFPDRLWMDHIGQDDEVEKNMIFYPAKSGLRLSGHAGLYVDFNFTDHWGLITGAEFGAYTSVVKSKNLLNMQALSTEYNFPRTGKSTLEDWVSENLPDFLEQHRMFAVQIPVMAKYMTPIVPTKGHQYYVAAGVKLGIRVSSQYKQSWGEVKYKRYGARGTNEEGEWNSYFLNTNNGPARDGGPAVCVDPYAKFPEESSRDTDWLKLKYSPVDVMASFDTGFRWNLGKGMGLYTGLYCDFGLIRPVPLQEGQKVLTLDKEKNPAIGDNDEGLTLDGAKYVSILAAEAPDYAYTTGYKPGETHDPGVWIKNSSPFAKTLSAMQAGVKIRLSFGKVQKPVKKVKPPKEPKQPKPKPEVVPPKIQRTMMELSNTLFAFDKFDLNEKAQEMLNEVADWLKENPDLNVEIGGHTDSRGSDAYNQRLSENRAKAVYDYFVSHGVSASRLSYKGYGESRPIATNETDEGRQLNRRVELQIQETQE